MIIQVIFGAAQTNVGYQFYDGTGALIGARTTTGINSGPGTGHYIIAVPLPDTAAGIFWDSTETPAGITEDLINVKALLRLPDILAAVESQRPHHTGQINGKFIYVDPLNGDTHANGARGAEDDPYDSIQDAHDNAVVSGRHDTIILLSSNPAGATIHPEAVTLTKRYFSIRGPGRDFIWTNPANGVTITITGDGISLEKFQLNTAVTGTGDGIQVSDSDFFQARDLWINDTQGDGIQITNVSNFYVTGCNFQRSGQAGSGHALNVTAGTGQFSSYGRIFGNAIEDIPGDGIRINPSGTGEIDATIIRDNFIRNCTGAGIDLIAAGAINTVIVGNKFAGNTEDYTNAGTNTAFLNNDSSYEDGAIWLDSVDGDDGNPGTDRRPVATIAAAAALLAKTGLTRVRVNNGSAVSLTVPVSNWSLTGEGWTLALNGQAVSGTLIQGAQISGAFTGIPILQRCVVGAISGAGAEMEQCGLTSSITATAPGNWSLSFCSSRIAGSGAPTFDFGAAVADTDLSMRNYSGGIELHNMGQLGVDRASIEGIGQIIINANCVGGDLVRRGIFKLKDNAAGAVSIASTDPTITAITEGTAQAGTANTITLAADASSTNGQYDPALILITNGAGAGQARQILDYDGTTKVAVIGRDWRTTPDATSSYVILAEAAPGHVNEGQAQGGTANTIILNTAASTQDDVYIGQTIFLPGGTGQDQTRVVTDYDGTTKAATVHRDWDTNPDATTSYIMTPSTGAGEYITSVADRVWDVGYADHQVAQSFGKIIDNIRKANLSIPGEVTDGISAGGINTNLADAAGTHDRQLLVFTSGVLEGASALIDQFLDGPDNSLTFQYDLPLLPSTGDAFVILPHHIHTTREIQAGLAKKSDVYNASQL